MAQLMFTPDGVCFNCLNGGHHICSGCKCADRGHRQWWFRYDGITNEREALERDDEKAKTPKREVKLYVRDVTGQLPEFSNDYHGSLDAYKRGEWFYLEVHARNVIGWWGPLALGVVSVDDEGRGYLQSVVTVDGARENGFAEMIVEAAGARWPRLYWHGCDASREFHARLVAKGIAIRRNRSDVYDFVPKNKRLSDEQT